MENFKKQAIATEVIKVLKSRFDSFPQNDATTRNAPFHKAFLNAFSDKITDAGTNINALLSMSSWMHGLNTTLGQTFFENVAQILSGGEKKTFTNNHIFASQMARINEIMTDLKNSQHIPNLTREDTIISENATGELTAAPNFTADCFFSDDRNVVAIELKSVRPNSGEMRGEKQKILTSKAFLGRQYPGKNIFYYVGFPFDPLSFTDIGYDKTSFMRSVIELTKFCAHEEVLLADEFWSFLSGEENTMQEILDIINSIATVDFLNEFDFIKDSNNLTSNTEEYMRIANKWNVYSEVSIVQNIQNIINAANNSIPIQRALNKSSFSDKGKYQEERAQILLNI